MDKTIKNILNKLEDNNFKAYVVGGYVRDYLLGISSLDIDICTNALPKDLHKLFPNNNNSNNYGGFNILAKAYNIDITTFRKELSYENRKPTELVYIDSLEEDILRRDFTINSICMDKDEKIIDLVGGVNDLNNRVIRMLGNNKKRLEEDPLRILRGIRFASILDFNLDEELFESMEETRELVSTLSLDRIKQELTKILLSKNFRKGLNLLRELHLLEIIGIDYDEDIVYVSDISGMWAQLKINKNYSFTKQENMNIINIRKIISLGKIDSYVLFTYGLYNSLVAGEILNISKKEITKKYNNLKIKSENDLAISSGEIIDLLNISPSKRVKEIRYELIMDILHTKLKNDNSELKEYLLEKYKY